jgi:Glycosyl transferase family 2
VISVVVPTIRGREEHYARCVAAYERTAGDRIELITIRDRPTCGLAWNEGAAQAKGDYIHFTADDLEPHDGWLEPALEAVHRGYLPAPRIIRTDGERDYCDYCGVHGRELPDKAIVDMSVIPFMSREQWDKIGPSLDCHYYTDNYLSWRGEQAGYLTVVRRAFQFTHHWAEPGRGAGMTYQQRMKHDRRIFEAATSGAAVS